MVCVYSIVRRSRAVRGHDAAGLFTQAKNTKKLTDCTVLSCENRAARHFLVLLLHLLFSLVGVEHRPLDPLISKNTLLLHTSQSQFPLLCLSSLNLLSSVGSATCGAADSCRTPSCWPVPPAPDRWRLPSTLRASSFAKSPKAVAKKPALAAHVPPAAWWNAMRTPICISRFL